MLKVFCCNGKAFVWNAKDAHTLRSEHRIVGSLVGCYPRQKFQNTYKYLPLQLLPEEASLLSEKECPLLSLHYKNTTKQPSFTTAVEKIRLKLLEIPEYDSIEVYWDKFKQGCQEPTWAPGSLRPAPKMPSLDSGIAQLLSNTEVLDKPDNILKEKYSEVKKLQCDPQLKKLNENRLQGILENVDTTGKRKRRKLLENTGESSSKRSKQNEHSESANDIVIDDVETDAISPAISEVQKKEIVEKAVSRLSTLTQENCSIQIFTEFPFKRDEANVPADWCYPKTATEKMKYLIFKDLWEKGYFLTAGTKFGGDFLVYLGNPLKFHALYIVVCIPNDQEIRADDLVTFGRLGNQVKKTVLLASTDAQDNVEYISLNWASNVTNEAVENEKDDAV